MLEHRGRLWTRTLALLLAVVMALAMAGLAGACDGDDDNGNGNGDGEAQAVEQTLRDALQAWNDGDADAFMALFTDDGLESIFDAPREEVEEFLPEFIGEDEISADNFRNTEVDGDTASTEVDFREGAGLSERRFTFVRQEGTWLIDGEEILETRIPEGVTAIDVELDEFEFRFDEDAIEDGNIAFRAENVGDQPHELVLVRIPEDANIEELLEAEEEPEGVEFFGFVEADPGDSANLVLAEPLGAGRYLMVCFFPDTDDPEETPHALLGMWSEFTLE